MKIETFFEKFEQLADAPNAMLMMRVLVLQLAVQGKLVGQDPAEGDADALLADIAESCNRERRGRSTSDCHDYELPEGDRWHQVPSGWRWVRLGMVGDIVGGGTPRSDNPTYFADQGIPWLTPADLHGFKEKRILRGRRCITQLGLENSSAQLLPAGSVLFSSRAPIGYVAIAGTQLSTNQGFKSCIPYVPETNEFIYYYLMSAASRIDREASGTTFREVSGKVVSKIPVPLPPLAEQKRIVAKVDELMALCDRLESQLQERDTQQAALARASLARFAEAPTPDNLNHLFHDSFTIDPAELRKTILNLAVQGKLVSQDPNDKPAGVLASELAEIRNQYLAEGKRRGQKIFDQPSEQELPFCIPDSWQWIPLGVAVTLLGGYAYESGTYVPRSLNQIIRLGNVKNDDLLLDQKPAHIPDSIAEKTKVFEIRAGDILITMTGTKAKRDYAFTLVVSQGHLANKRLFLNQRVGAIRPFRREIVPLINMFLKADQLLDLIFATATGTANQANIGAASILDLPFPLPPLSEQRRIVAKVDQLIALVDQLEVQLAASRSAAMSLMTAVVAELTAEV